MVSACRSVIQYLGNTEDDVILSVLPLSFSYGLYQVLMCFVFGGTVILDPGFVYPHASLKRISQEKVTGFPIVPSILATILRLGDASAYGISRLRYMTNAGAALPEPLVRRFRSLFPNVAFYSMYGLTECKRVSYLPPEDLDRLCSSVGRAMPNCEVRLVDEEGREVQPGAVGELIVRGSNVMQGYWHDPEGSRDTFRPGAYHSDRWLRTGDMFTSDAEGNLYHAGRRDDMIKCRGERVSPREVEAALLRIGGILEAAVRGVPDEADGQAIAAFVVVSPGSGLTLPKIRRECSRYLESTRVPRHIKLLDRLPRNDRGKIDWKELNPWDAQEKST
jgi:acyl-CoA synthetase (AMP-forming)/AMP-acid ligase II